MQRELLLGVDGGGTRCRARLAEISGAILGEVSPVIALRRGETERIVPRDSILTFADYALCLVAGRAADGGTNTSFAMTVSMSKESAPGPLAQC